MTNPIRLSAKFINLVFATILFSTYSNGQVKSRISVDCAPEVVLIEVTEDISICDTQTTTITVNSSVPGKWIRGLGTFATIVSPNSKTTQVSNLSYLSNAIFQWVPELTSCQTLNALSDVRVTVVAKESPVITGFAKVDFSETQSMITVNVAQSGSYEYEWTTENGVIVSGQNTKEIVVSKTGSYKVSISKPAADFSPPCPAVQSYQLDFSGSNGVFTEDFGTGNTATNEMPNGALTEFGLLGKENFNSNDPGSKVPMSNCPINQGPNDGGFLIQSAVDNQYYGQNFCGASNVLAFDGWYDNYEDHTSGDSQGKYMVVNGGGGVTGKVFYQKTLRGLIAGNDYSFSTYVMNIINPMASCIDTDELPVVIEIEIYEGSAVDGVPVSQLSSSDLVGFNAIAPVTPSELSDLWQKMELIFTAPSENITLVLRDKGGSGCGNDFALDDIELRPTDLLDISTVEQKTIGYGPNPVKDILSIENETPILTIQVYDITGQLVKEDISLRRGNSIDLSALSSGIYVVKIYFEDNQEAIKVIKE